jgi:hypothetical protein
MLLAQPAQVLDATLLLHSLIMPGYDGSQEEEEAHRRRFNALIGQVQTTSLAWSPTCRVDALTDRCLLATGHRSGHITFWA